MSIKYASIELTILIVSYNTRAETLACLASVVQYPPSCSYELIVLDNASPDGSAEAIATAFPQVALIRSSENLGFACGNNHAACHARGRRLLLLNPDTLVSAESLSALWHFAEHHTAARIWGGRTVFPDGTLNKASCWADISVWSLFCSTFGLTWLAPQSAWLNPEAFGGWQRDSVRSVDIVSGCFLMIDHQLWRDLGGFDPAFFMYAEEADLCTRARRHGARPMITPASTIVHLGGVSEPSQVEKVMKIHRGRVTLMRKHWPRALLSVGLALYWLWALLRLIGSRALHGPRDLPGQSTAKWGYIWQHRHIWLAGY